MPYIRYGQPVCHTILGKYMIHTNKKSCLNCFEDLCLHLKKIVVSISEVHKEKHEYYYHDYTLNYSDNKNWYTQLRKQS